VLFAVDRHRAREVTGIATGLPVSRGRTGAASTSDWSGTGCQAPSASRTSCYAWHGLGPRTQR
jgi:hypothetical protein